MALGTAQSQQAGIEWDRFRAAVGKSRADWAAVFLGNMHLILTLARAKVEEWPRDRMDELPPDPLLDLFDLMQGDIADGAAERARASARARDRRRANGGAQ